MHAPAMGNPRPAREPGQRIPHPIYQSILMPPAAATGRHQGIHGQNGRDTQEDRRVGRGLRTHGASLGAGGSWRRTSRQQELAARDQDQACRRASRHRWITLAVLAAALLATAPPPGTRLLTRYVPLARNEISRLLTMIIQPAQHADPLRWSPRACDTSTAPRPATSNAKPPPNNEHHDLPLEC